MNLNTGTRWCNAGTLRIMVRENSMCKFRPYLPGSNSLSLSVAGGLSLSGEWGRFISIGKRFYMSMFNTGQRERERERERGGGTDSVIDCLRMIFFFKTEVLS